MPDNSDALTQPLRDRSTTVAEKPIPSRIGRFLVQSILGQGGFGVVYLALDEQLQRRVALKVPHPELVARPEDTELYLKEARTVAGLEHPNIVPVLEVGSTPEFPIFVVSKYIDGHDLAFKMKSSRLSTELASRWIVDLADALRAAHKLGVVHRDVKPQNVLIDGNDIAFLVDFGLALRDEDVGKRLPTGGTPAYMSPEQVRGEGHRVDGRSDIFSLGVLSYELLTGRRPFSGASHLELFEQINELDPKPIRQWNEDIDRELERICLKMLAKRKSERYSSATDLIEDLDAYLVSSRASSTPADTRADSLPATVRSSNQALAPTVVDQTPLAITPTSGSQTLRIVPKGLRSFDQHDADFFLELLPGPRDRHGLPDTIGFWKSRIEERDSDKTFNVGLVYGPSGCGKSSMMKAGLLPRLSSDVCTLYLEATPDQTESTLLAMLHKRFDAEQLRYDKSLNLTELASAIRRGRLLPASRKVLLVIDQFEQWLYSHTQAAGTQLLDTLLQCDGARLQSIIMVRDDFWMAATRFFRDLDIPLVERQNSAAVDLFDIDHAERVLKAFGRAFGKLEAEDKDEKADRKQFISASVRGLAEENKVISVRLSLFAEMMKARPWTPESLHEVGGTAGVGVTFLEETFSAAIAPPAHRYHQVAARAVLRLLLPNAGTEIKGHCRSRAELLVASGYEFKQRDFVDLMRILDSELRLITPVDDTGEMDQLPFVDAGASNLPGGSLDQQKSASTIKYQLTHDYLVPSLREWLTRKQRETKRGRAELKLEERASAWNAKREIKQLPTLVEWFSIGRLTDRKSWTESQRSMMRSATRVHTARVGLAAMLIVAITGMGLATKAYVDQQQDALVAKNRTDTLEAEASSRVDGLLKVDSSNLVSAVDSLREYREWAQDDLTNAFKNSTDDSNAKLYAGLALLSLNVASDSDLLNYLKERLLAAAPHQLNPVRTLMESHKSPLVPEYWQIALDDKLPAMRRFYAATALAAFDPSNTEWDESNFAAFISEQLVAVSPSNISQYQELLRPVSAKLVPSLALIFKDPARGEIARALSTALLADYAAQDPETLVELVIAADPSSDKVLFPILQKNHLEVAIKRFESILDRSLKPNWHDAPIDKSWVEPDAAIQASIESAHGLIHDHFAYVVDIPLDRFLETVEKLRASGFRPTRVRPFLRPLNSITSGDDPGNAVVMVAAIWTRDSKRWLLEASVPKSALPTPDMNAEKGGLLINDVSVIPTTDDATDPTCIVLWSEPMVKNEQRRVVIDVSEQELTESITQFAAKEIRSQQTIAVRTTSDGDRLYSAIWSTDGAESELRPAYAGFELIHQPQWDVAVAPAGRLSDPRDAYRKQLATLANLPAERFEDPKLRELRAIAYFKTDQLENALAEFDAIIENNAVTPTISTYHILTLARLGKREQAYQSLEKYLSTNPQASLKSYLQIQLPAWLGDVTKAWTELQAAASSSDLTELDLYNIACASALCSQAIRPIDAEQSNKFADRTIELLEQLINQGYRKSTFKSDVDFLALHDDPRFTQLLSQIEPSPRFAAVWQADIHFESKLVVVDTTKQPPDSSSQLINQGYRPQAIAADTKSEAPSSNFTLLFHLPVIPDEEKETLAIRQSAAATTLIRLDAAERVWPLLQDQPDPRVRSYILHRLANYGVDPQSLLKQFNTETDISRRRSLILGLGEFARSQQLSDVQRASLISDLGQLYANDPDSGIHGAAEWTLRQLGAVDEIIKIKGAFSTGSPVGDRRWYLTQTGVNKNTSLALTIIHPSDEFIMSSPVHELERLGGPTGISEIQHRRRIGRSFAIGQHEVTVAQYSEFRSQHSFDNSTSRTNSTPANLIRWYDAAGFCNWLSEQEGIPRDQWCYIQEQGFAEGMLLLPDYLQRIGYRLPSEAEWEYACRAGTTTSRYFGQTERLLSDYAWYTKQSGNERLLTVGSLRPNAFGLFDMYGNLMEWCQERHNSYGTNTEIVLDKELPEKISNSSRRVMRGGSFTAGAVNVRSSNRSSSTAATPVFSAGFRVARTYR